MAEATGIITIITPCAFARRAARAEDADRQRREERQQHELREGRQRQQRCAEEEDQERESGEELRVTAGRTRAAQSRYKRGARFRRSRRGAGGEEARRWKLLPMAHASYRVLCGQLRAEKRTQRQLFGDVKLISPNVNVRHRTKRGQSQGIPGRHRRLKKIFF